MQSNGQPETIIYRINVLVRHQARQIIPMEKRTFTMLEAPKPFAAHCFGYQPCSATPLPPLPQHAVAVGRCT